MSATPRYDISAAEEAASDGPEARARTHERTLLRLLEAEQELAGLRRSIADLSHPNLQQLLRERDEQKRARDTFEDAALRAACIGMATINVHCRPLTEYRAKKLAELSAIHAMCEGAFARNHAAAESELAAEIVEGAGGG